jgi:cytochrome c oxidase assembly factor 3
MFGVATGIWAYSISAVRQDTFEDLDEEARALARGPGRATTGEPSNTVIGGGSSSNIVTAGANTTSLQTKVTPLSVAAAAKDHAAGARSTTSRGLLPSSVLDRKIPRLLDPANKTLVWGAPPVDAVGKMGSLWKP